MTSAIQQQPRTDLLIGVLLLNLAPKSLKIESCQDANYVVFCVTSNNSRVFVQRNLTSLNVYWPNLPRTCFTIIYRIGTSIKLSATDQLKYRLPASVIAVKIQPFLYGKSPNSLPLYVYYCVHVTEDDSEDICFSWVSAWWRHKRETFSVLRALCEGIPLTKVSTTELWCFLRCAP